MTDRQIEQLNWLHSLVQELESEGVELPMGDYGIVYSIIEGLRDEECNTCGDTGRWMSTTEDSPTELVDLGPCPDCMSDDPTNQRFPHTCQTGGSEATCKACLLD